jgi:transcription antitermination factor NusG
MPRRPCRFGYGTYNVYTFGAILSTAHYARFLVGPPFGSQSGGADVKRWKTSPKRRKRSFVLMLTTIEPKSNLPNTWPRWYAAYTKPCHEKRVAEHLEIRKIELFLPLYCSARRWNNGCVPPDRPLFPGYVFVHIPTDERVRVLELSGVVSIVGTMRKPTPLPDEDIERLRSGLHLVHAEPHATLAVGETVRIRRGPLQGMTGVVTRQKNSFRVVLTVDLIMKSVAVEVPLSDVEPVGQPAPAICREMAFSAAN